jgi:hypothetical protein
LEFTDTHTRALARSLNLVRAYLHWIAAVSFWLFGVALHCFFPVGNNAWPKLCSHLSFCINQVPALLYDEIQLEANILDLRARATHIPATKEQSGFSVLITPPLCCKNCTKKERKGLLAI